MTHDRPYPDFDLRTLTFRDVPREVYVGGHGPAVIVMHEIPGLYPAVVEFARRVVSAGFTVYMPSMLGSPGRPLGPLYVVGSMTRACVSNEFTVWATGQNSPITEWLRDLAAHAHRECGGPGVGAVGMCLTGGFALAMMVDEVMLAPVLSQPSLPFGVTREQRRDLGIDDATLARVKERTRAGACVMGLRFTGDRLVPAERFARLREELGANFIGVEIDSSLGNPHGIPPWAHSVLTKDHVAAADHPTEKALQQVLDFYRERLRPQPA